MSRSGYFLFNVIIAVVLYAIVYAGGSRREVLVYTVTYFSVPYIAVNFLMAVYCLLRWFMSQDHDTAKEGMTFLNATWITALLTFVAYEFLNAGGYLRHIIKVFPHV